MVQHTSAEYLGLIEDHLEGRSIRFRYHRPFTGKAPLPAAEALGQGLILLGGGPWGSAGVRDVPTLKEEIALARAALEQEQPVIGIGLGAQILRDLGISSIRLMTSARFTYVGLGGFGIEITETETTDA